MYPPFIEELRGPQHRSKLWLGVWSGYALAAVFAVFLLAGQAFELVSAPWALYALVAAKVATNTLAWWGLRRDWLVLETSGLNVMADLAVMTGAIHFTGGVVSPLFPIYVIEITVLALLANLRVTILSAALILVCYSAMALATYAGMLEQHPAPAVLGVIIAPGYLGLNLLFAAFVLGVPTVYVSLILRQLAAKRTELELRNVELIEAGKQKSQFMANVTHELRTPIHGVCGLSQLLESGIYGPMTDKQKQAVDSIQRSAKGQLQLVDELLVLSKAEAGKLEVRAEPVALGELVEGAMSAARWMLGTKAMTLETDVPAALTDMVTDRAKLNQVLINLLSNAAKFTPEGGAISAKVRASGTDKLAIAIADTGAGIPADAVSSIFEAFRQVDGSDEREFGGVGLGLSLCKRLVDLLGGTIAVDSVVGKGTTFTVLLPRDVRTTGRSVAA